MIRDANAPIVNMKASPNILVRTIKVDEISSSDSFARNDYSYWSWTRIQIM